MANQEIDNIIEEAVFSEDAEVRTAKRKQIREMAAAQGIRPSSIQGLYEAAGRGEYSHKTVPAINVRAMNYYTARAIFRTAKKYNVGAFILEIARSEMGYTDQNPDEFSASLLAAAVRDPAK